MTVNCDNETQQTEKFTSCAHAHQVDPDLPSGVYTIQPSGGSPVTGGGGWTRVASCDYSDPNTMCPNSWTQITSPVRG